MRGRAVSEKREPTDAEVNKASEIMKKMDELKEEDRNRPLHKPTSPVSHSFQPGTGPAYGKPYTNTGEAKATGDKSFRGMFCVGSTADLDNGGFKDKD